MKHLLFFTMFLLVVSVPIFSATVMESWEGAYTVLAVRGTGNPPLIAEIRAGWPIDPIHGTQYVQLINHSPTGTPEAYVAWVKGLHALDEVTASLWVYRAEIDTLRLRAHWNPHLEDIDVNSGEAGGIDYVHSGTGWEEVTASWQLANLPINYMGLVVKVPVDIAYGDTICIDAMTVTSTGAATITTRPAAEVPAVRGWVLAVVLAIAGAMLLRKQTGKSRA